MFLFPFLIEPFQKYHLKTNICHLSYRCADHLIFEQGKEIDFSEEIQKKLCVSSIIKVRMLNIYKVILSGCMLLC